MSTGWHLGVCLDVGFGLSACSTFFGGCACCHLLLRQQTEKRCAAMHFVYGHCVPPHYMKRATLATPCKPSTQLAISACGNFNGEQLTTEVTSLGLTCAWCVCYGGGAENDNAGIRGHGCFSTGLFALVVLRLPTRVRGEAGFLGGTANAQRVNIF